MKRYINLLFFLSLLLYSCQDTEVAALFDQSPEERSNAQLEQMKNELVDSPYGWTIFYQYNNMTNENYFNVLFKDDGRAVINYPLADGTVGSETTTYSLRYTQQIDLVFDTYSIFASMVGNEGGDFRFEFSRREDNKIYFNTRNDETEGSGILELSKTSGENDYKELVALQAKVVDDPARSFYRVITLDTGEKYLMNILSMNLAWIEWSAQNEINREKRKLVLVDGGFELEEPLQIGDALIKRFVSKDDGTFEVWSDNAKIGVLDYGNKPFNYPNSVSTLLNESGQGFFVVEQYSSNFTTLIDNLEQQDPLFTHLQFYFANGFLAYYRSNATVRHMIFMMNFGASEDAISMAFTNRVGNAEAVDYLDMAVETLLQFHNKTYTVVPRNGLFYLVQDQDPSIWMIIEPQ